MDKFHNLMDLRESTGFFFFHCNLFVCIVNILQEVYIEPSFKAEINQIIKDILSDKIFIYRL